MFDKAHNVTSKASRTKIKAMVVSDSGNDDNDEMGSMSKDSGDDDDKTGSVSGDNKTDSVSGDNETGSVSGGKSVHEIYMSTVMKLQACKTIFFTTMLTRVMKAHLDIYGDKLVQYMYAQAVRDGVVKNIDIINECFTVDDSFYLDARYDRLIPPIDRFIKDVGVKWVIVYTRHVHASRSGK
ncbi:hypothetical protein GGF31_003475, partial [Allomyces arbusculus]